MAKYWSVNQRKPPENNSYKDCSNQGTVQVPTSKNEKEKKNKKKTPEKIFRSLTRTKLTLDFSLIFKGPNKT